MNIKLYQVTDPKNALVKTCPEPGEGSSTILLPVTSANFISANDKKSPILRIVSAVDLTPFNYVYIDFFNRYYFCEVEATANGCYTLSCTTDLLMTYQAELQALTVNVVRNEYYQDTYYRDEYRKARAYKNIVTKKFPNGLTSDTFVLMTVGNKVIP